MKGEVLLAKADLRGAIRQFDEAIRLDESNPVPLYNKGLTLIQMNQFEAHNAQKLFESALAVDPTCMVALMRLSELKLQLAASFDQAQAVVDMLGGAMQNCRDKDELVELSTVRAMAVAQLAAARDVGLTCVTLRVGGCCGGGVGGMGLRAPAALVGPKAPLCYPPRCRVRSVVHAAAAAEPSRRAARRLGKRRATTIIRMPGRLNPI